MSKIIIKFQEIYSINKSALCWTVIVLPLLIISGCNKNNSSSEELKTYRKKLAECQVKLSESPLVPLTGGGYIDMRRFGSNHYSPEYENGQCGASLFGATQIFWTGKEILPNNRLFTEMNLREIPSGWKSFNVTIGFRKNNKFCEKNSKNCEKPQKLPSMADVSPELIVRLKKYDLDMALSRTEIYKGNKLSITDFFIRDFLREDGKPLMISCRIDHDFGAMSREQLENIDFNEPGKWKNGWCEIRWGFHIKGGGAIVDIGLHDLHGITPALKALQKYISDSVIKDK